MKYVGGMPGVLTNIGANKDFAQKLRVVATRRRIVSMIPMRSVAQTMEGSMESTCSIMLGI
jgi:hypothetical protein